MNWLDYVFIGIISLSVIVSLFRGLIKEVLSLLIWLGAFWVAYHFVDVGADSLINWIEVPSARHLIAFVALFLAALIIGGIINFIVGKLVKKTGLSGTDRFFGMFFGALRALIAIVAITFFIKATPLSEDPWWQQSKLAPKFSKISEWVRLNMPDEFSGYFTFVEKDNESEIERMIKDVVADTLKKQKKNESDEE
ncbi:MAG: CvpA family protein [Alcanivoracaceae bacterium]|nr:CvpA family protein [Alcanivoracaceae bacterium]